KAIVFLILSFFAIQALPQSTLFPYTTLFRSLSARAVPVSTAALAAGCGSATFAGGASLDFGLASFAARTGAAAFDFSPRASLARSEEHTSELQSRENLVCRLLLEKKKRYQIK